MLRAMPAPTTAGWLADPTGRHQHRYHDGTRWTAHVADAGVQQYDPHDLAALNPPPPPGPSRLGYWIAGGIAVAGLIAAIVVGVTGFVDTIQRPEHYARMPGTGTLATTVHEPGERVVYVEDGTIQGMGIGVVGPDGAPVRVRGYGLSTTYDVAGHSGRAVARFDADVPGAYAVTVRGEALTGAGFAVGPDLLDGIVAMFLVPLVVFAAVGLVAGGVAVATGVWRTRQRRALSA
jgi:hypothetical protein